MKPINEYDGSMDAALAAASSFFGIDKPKPKPDPVRQPTLAERLLSLDNPCGMWGSALTEQEWGLWKLIYVFGFTPIQDGRYVAVVADGEVQQADSLMRLIVWTSKRNARSSRPQKQRSCGTAGTLLSMRKRFGTNTQYLDHLADDVMPVILRTAFKIANEAG